MTCMKQKTQHEKELNLRNDMHFFCLVIGNYGCMTVYYVLRAMRAGFLIVPGVARQGK